MAKEVITSEWIDALPSKVTGPVKILADALVPALHVAYNDLMQAVQGAEDGNPRAYALKLWEESGSDDFAVLTPIREKLIKVQDLLAETQAAYDDAVDKGIKPFIAEANAKAEELKATATNELVSKRTVLSQLLLQATGKQVNVPALPGAGKGHQDGESVPRPDLATATVDGEPVIPANGTWPVMSDIHRVVAAKYNLAVKVRELSRMIFAAAKTKEVPADGLTVNLTINDKPVVITMTPRAEKDKPQRGKAAK